MKWDMRQIGNGNAKAFEDIDEKVLGTLLDARGDFTEGLRIALLPDHPTPCAIKTHARDPVPFVIYDSNVLPNPEMADRRFTEISGQNAEFGLLPDGESFMRLFLEQSP